ncbi:hypothetical protein Fcan01_26899 [Folsomia candida]|uniref:Uncharacterized protein n=1 Tax=Folsomia candida TaxID=158441 RepID=A0A226D0L3_FOLCA|nr:hypothetical protein Fcan01_26899 [Folsomia candida]
MDISPEFLIFITINMFLIFLNLKNALSFTISNLNEEILSPFAHCAIHILTFQRIDYVPPSCPVVLTLYSLDHTIEAAMIPVFNAAGRVDRRPFHKCSSGIKTRQPGQYSLLVLSGPDSARIPLNVLDAWLELVRLTTNSLITDKIVFFLGNQTSIVPGEELVPIYQKYFVCDIYNYVSNASTKIKWQELSSIDFKIMEDCKVSLARGTTWVIYEKDMNDPGLLRFRRLSIIQRLQTLSPLNYDLATNYQYFIIALFVPNITFTAATYVWWDRLYYSNQPTIIANYEDDLDISYPTLDQQLFCFLTCSGTSIASYNFQAYITMYDNISWSFALVLCFLSSILLWLGLNVTLPKEATWKKGNWDWPFRVLLEQGVDNICEQSGLKRIATRIMLGAWFVMGVILSNGYRGNNIYELTSPLKISGPRTISDLVKAQVEIYSRFGVDDEEEMKDNLKLYCRNDSYADMLRDLSLPGWKDDIYQAFQNQTVLPRCTGQLAADVIFSDDIERYAKLNNMIDKTMTASDLRKISPQNPCSSISGVGYDKFRYLHYDSTWSDYDHTSFSLSVRATEFGRKLKSRLYALCMTQVGEHIVAKDTNISFNLTKYVRLIPFLQVSTPLLSILNTIQECNETSFIGWDSDVKLIRMMYYERHPEKKIFMGTDPIFTRNIRFAIRGFWGRPAVLRMFSLIESGLAAEWREIRDFNQVLKIHSGEKNKSRVDNRMRVKTLAIGDNIVTVFYLLLICIGVPMIAFLVEVTVRNRRAILFHLWWIVSRLIIKVRNRRKMKKHIIK